jgi:hypothetical protein
VLIAASACGGRRQSGGDAGVAGDAGVPTDAAGGTTDGPAAGTSDGPASGARDKAAGDGSAGGWCGACKQDRCRPEDLECEADPPCPALGVLACWTGCNTDACLRQCAGNDQALYDAAAALAACRSRCAVPCTYPQDAGPGCAPQGAVCDPFYPPASTCCEAGGDCTALCCRPQGKPCGPSSLCCRGGAGETARCGASGLCELKTCWEVGEIGGCAGTEGLPCCDSRTVWTKTNPGEPGPGTTCACCAPAQTVVSDEAEAQRLCCSHTYSCVAGHCTCM